MVKLNGLTRILVKSSQCTFIGKHLRPEVSSMWSAESTHHQEKQRRIGVMKFIPTCTSFLLLVGVSLSAFFHQWRPSCMNLSCTALSFWLSRLVLSAMYHIQTDNIYDRSLIRAIQWSIMRSHSSVPAPSLLIMLMDCSFSHMHSLSSLSIPCVVKPPLPCNIHIVSAAHRLPPTPVFSARTRTCRVRICNVLESATTDFAKQKASHYILCSPWWSMIEWWISNPC